MGASTEADAPHDDALVLAAREGDRSALETLLRRHQDRVHALCRRIVGSDDDALDATQEALIAIVRGIGRFDGRSAFSTWVYRVSTNAALDERRRRARRPLVGLPEEVEDRPSARDTANAVAAQLDVDGALRLLPPEQRAAVVLRDLFDLDYAEIAAVLEVPIGTVRSRIARGRAAIADALRDGPPIEEPGNQTPLRRRPTSGTTGPAR